jgi:hypothetical protein
MAKVVLNVGTTRGLFLFESNRDRSRWTMKGPFLKGWQVYHAVTDTRGTPKVHVAGLNDMAGTTTFSAGLKGLRFQAAKTPPRPPKLPAKAAKLVREWKLPSTPTVWHIEPGHVSEKRVLYAGTAPAALFRSEDSGKTWQEIRSLTKHPTRKDWFPGAGGMCLHSIQLDPTDPDRMLIAISAAGAFRTDDAGKSWKPINKAVAKFTGAPKGSEVGTCVHKMLLHPAVPGLVYQENHVGTYRSDDYGDTWYSIGKGLPFDFGFGLALDPGKPDTCYTIPLEPEGYMFRRTPGKFRVYQWSGRTKWKPLSKGLPGSGAYLGVKREGMGSDTMNPTGLYVGTSNGQVFASRNRGQSWNVVAEYLPPVLSVSAAVV